MAGIHCGSPTYAREMVDNGFKFVAEVYGELGKHEEGLSCLSEALALVKAQGVCYDEADMWRLKGTLILGQSLDSQSNAETCFQQALDIACRQRAKSLELRAAISLARLWQQQDKCQDAYDLLTPVYNWIIEGFDTADLQDAKTLLDTLA